MGSARQSLSLLRVRQWRLPTIPFTGSLYGEEPGRSFLFVRNDLKSPSCYTRCGPRVLHVRRPLPTIESNLHLHLGGWRLGRKTGLFSQSSLNLGDVHKGGRLGSVLTFCVCVGSTVSGAVAQRHRLPDGQVLPPGWGEASPLCAGTCSTAVLTNDLCLRRQHSFGRGRATTLASR